MMKCQQCNGEARTKAIGLTETRIAVLGDCLLDTSTKRRMANEARIADLESALRAIANMREWEAEQGAAATAADALGRSAGSVRTMQSEEEWRSDAIGRHPGQYPEGGPAPVPLGGDPGVADSTPAASTLPRTDPRASNPKSEDGPTKCERCSKPHLGTSVYHADRCPNAPDPSDAPADKCLWCGKKDSLGFCPGVCLSCGDRMMTLEKSALIIGMAKAVADVKRLEHQTNDAPHTCPESDPGPDDITAASECKACHPEQRTNDAPAERASPYDENCLECRGSGLVGEPVQPCFCRFRTPTCSPDWKALAKLNRPLAIVPIGMRVTFPAHPRLGEGRVIHSTIEVIWENGERSKGAGNCIEPAEARVDKASAVGSKRAADACSIALPEVRNGVAIGYIVDQLEKAMNGSPNAPGFVHSALGAFRRYVAEVKP